jgi:hypothetical protein
MKKGLHEAGGDGKVKDEPAVKAESKITKRMMEGEEPHHDEL